MAQSRLLAPSKHSLKSFHFSAYFELQETSLFTRPTIASPNWPKILYFLFDTDVIAWLRIRSPRLDREKLKLLSLLVVTALQCHLFSIWLFALITHFLLISRWFLSPCTIRESVAWESSLGCHALIHSNLYSCVVPLSSYVKILDHGPWDQSVSIAKTNTSVANFLWKCTPM